MPKFHAVLIDECGSEFGADVVAADHDTAHDMMRENYPESRIVQLESARDTREREHRMYTRLLNEDY